MKLKTYMKILMSSIMLLSFITPLTGQTRDKIELIYDNVWGSLYNPELKQCDKTPTITADGSVIDTLNASKQRWIAVSQDLLCSPRRHKLFVKDSTDNRYQGKIKFGDTIWIESPNPNINGKWVVHDLMNKKYKNAVDFLQTTGDGDLYDNNKLWDGKFKIISVYKINKNTDDYVPKITNPGLWLLRPSIVISAVNVSYESIQRDSVKYLDLVKRILHRDDLIRVHDKSVDNYWKAQSDLEKTKRQIDSLQIEIRKYYKQIELYRKMIRDLEKKRH